MSTLITAAPAGNGSEHKTHSLVSYILLIIGMFTAIPLLIGAVWAMVNKKNALGTEYHSHFVNATRVFWWSLFWTVVGVILLAIGIGYLIWLVAWVWALYRVVNGLVKVLEDEPYPL